MPKEPLRSLRGAPEIRRSGTSSRTSSVPRERSPAPPARSAPIHTYGAPASSLRTTSSSRPSSPSIWASATTTPAILRTHLLTPVSTSRIPTRPSPRLSPSRTIRTTSRRDSASPTHPTTAGTSAPARRSSAAASVSFMTATSPTSSPTLRPRRQTPSQERSPRPPAPASPMPRRG